MSVFTSCFIHFSVDYYLSSRETTDWICFQCYSGEASSFSCFVFQVTTHNMTEVLLQAMIIFYYRSISWLSYRFIVRQMSENSDNFPKPKQTFILLVLSNQQSKTQRYSVYIHRRLMFIFKKPDSVNFSQFLLQNYVLYEANIKIVAN